MRLFTNAIPTLLMRSALALVLLVSSMPARAHADEFIAQRSALDDPPHDPSDDPMDDPSDDPMDDPMDDPFTDTPPADPGAVPPTTTAPTPSIVITRTGFTLADATPEESEALNRLASSKSWTSRALAAMRLERFDCEASAGRLRALTIDASWRVRAYAFACSARRGIVMPPEALLAERDVMVMRTILRCRYPLPAADVDTRIAAHEKSGQPIPAMLALEILAAQEIRDDKPHRKRMDELLSNIVLRMDRTEGGTLSPRLAIVTGGDDSGRNYRWREWYRKNKKKLEYRSSALVPSPPSGERLTQPNRIAQLDATAFLSFEQYLALVATRPMDLAILLDCTASMSREISQAQGGVDDLFDFFGSVTKGVRIAIVGYRDRGDEWETKAWDFSPNLADARTRLWSLAADGGGDTPESVFAAMKLALTKFTWLPDATQLANQPIRATVIIGDAPPHAGEASLCIDLARRGFARGVRFYGIIARDHESNLKDEDEEGAVTKPAATPRDEDARKDDRQDGAQGDSDKSEKIEDKSKSKSNGKNSGKGNGKVAPPKAPPPSMQKKPSYTRFPEIAEAGGGRADILREQDSLVAEIAELTIADRYRAEFSEFFEAFRLLCR